MATKVDISSLEGWLVKKRGPGKQKVLGILSGDTKRWFQVKELVSSDRVDITLCYFKSQHETEARGWIYLKDVTELYEDGKTITIVSMARSITIEAKSRAEHKFWLDGISLLCPFANMKNQGEIPCYADDKDSSRGNSRGSQQSGSRRGDSQNSSRRDSLVESKAERKNSMDSTNTGANMTNMEDRHDRQIRMAESKDSQRDSQKESLRVLSAPNSARSSASGHEGADYPDGIVSNSRDRDRDGHRETTETRESREGRGSRDSREGRNNRFDREPGTRDRDDHRLSTYSTSPTRGGNGATSRLHSHIRKEIPSSLNTSQEVLRSGGTRSTNMREREDKPVEMAARKPSPGRAIIQEYNGDDEDIETLNVSTESQFSMNSNRQRLKERRESEQRNQRRGSSDDDERSQGRHVDPQQSQLTQQAQQRWNSNNNNHDSGSDDDIDTNSESHQGSNQGSIHSSNHGNNQGSHQDDVILHSASVENKPNRNRQPQSDLAKTHYNRNTESKRGEDSDDEDRAVLDLKKEKERRNSHQAQAEEKETQSPVLRTDMPARGRPPLPPSGAKPNPYTAIGKLPPPSSSAPRVNQAAPQVSSDVDFAHDDWDDEDDDDARVRDLRSTKRSPIRNHQVQVPVNVGVRADSNWLHENFDED